MTTHSSWVVIYNNCNVFYSAVKEISDDAHSSAVGFEPEGFGLAGGSTIRLCREFSDAKRERRRRLFSRLTLEKSSSSTVIKGERTRMWSLETSCTQTAVRVRAADASLERRTTRGDTGCTSGI